MTKTMLGISEFNPKNLPMEIFGKCDYENHYEIVDYPNLKTKNRLMMLYSDEYISGWLENDNSIRDNFDRDYEKFEKIKWKPESELYCCEPCAEELSGI